MDKKTPTPSFVWESKTGSSCCQTMGQGWMHFSLKVTFLSSILVLTKHHFCSSRATLCSVFEPELESSRLSSISLPLASSWLYTSSLALNWLYSSCKEPPPKG